ncbi:MAG: tol-pal system-associated acyl-CoA thioesterase [Robiginitomaculum sp.]|nr:tol-pal system-associated acyl-CoA thioesterase [Robiginitomaculum sp.]
MLPIRIYYEDTDFSGIVYHGSYLKFLERARTESMRVTGTSHQDLLLLDPPLAFTVRKLNMDFLAPARIDQVVEVRTKFVMAKGARMRLLQEVLCEQRVLLRASVEIACIDLKGRAKRIPKSILDKMLPYLSSALT